MTDSLHGRSRRVKPLAWIGLITVFAVVAALDVARELYLATPIVIPAAQRVNRPAGQSPTILFLGDTAPTDAATPFLRQHGFDYPFAATAEVVRAADLAIVNLEAPIAPAGTAFGPWKKYLYRIEPAAVAGLVGAGIDMVGLANNHAMDCGRRGLAATLAAGPPLIMFGAGLTEADARRGAIVHLGDVRVGILGYREANWADGVWSRAFAQGSRGGVARLSESAVRADVQRLSPEADVTIAFVHWGENYQGVTSSQRTLAQVLADAGVDLVVGHHPHIVQPLQRIGDTVVAYSIGNYAFGTPGRAALRSGIMLRATLSDRRFARIEAIPIDVQNRRVRFQPKILRGEAARRELAPIVEASAKARVHLTIRDGIAFLVP